MRRYFLKIFGSAILFALFSAFPLLSIADTSKIVILPDGSASVLPNTLSAQMTVQSQDENGPTKTVERINLTFESSSPTGEFFTAAGNSLDSYKYIGADTSNRNFAYKDSSEGTFTLTITGVGEITNARWTAIKQITVSAGGLQSGDSGEVLGISSGSSEPQSSGVGSTEEFLPSPALEVAGGGDRSVPVGSPVRFQANIKKNTSRASLEFSWSFGDGNVGGGSVASHIYKYPGEYVVVLSAKGGDAISVSRLKVKVFDSNLSVYDRGGYLEIYNGGDAEINLFNWKIENEGFAFIFQPNTIVLPRSSIKIDKSLLKIKGSGISLGISLKNYLGEEVFSVSPKADVSGKLESLKKEFYSIQEKAKTVGVANVQNIGAGLVSRVQVAAPVLASEILAEEEKITSAEAVAAVIYEAPRMQGIWGRAWNFLKGVLR